MRRLLPLVACGLGLLGTASTPVDPLAAEIARAMAAVAAIPAEDTFATEVRKGVEPALLRARAALAAGRRHQALHLYAQVVDGVAAAEALRQRTAGERDMAALEARWRASADLRTRSAVPTLRPALVQALAEAASAQAPVLYDASLDYGRSTTADSGFYYLEAARAQQQLVGILGRLQESSPGTSPPVRDIGAEIDSLRGELLAAYRPPAAIEQHVEFISASAALKEARELNAAGLHHGALLRYLQGAQRFGRLRAAGAAAPVPALPPGMDHSVVQAFLEAADEARASGDAERTRTASAVADVVVPRYLAAIAPATPSAAPPAGSRAVTVTLVRWPYT